MSKHTSSTGFPSPADDYLDTPPDLNRLIVAHPAATFFVRVSERGGGGDVKPGDVLAVDRSLRPAAGRLVVAVVEGDFVVRRLKRGAGGMVLAGDEDELPLGDGADASIWGVVTWILRKEGAP